MRPIVQQEAAEALQEVVARACTCVDARLKALVLDSFGFLRHCKAIKRFLFFGQGDFSSALVHHTADLLPMRASQVMPLELSGRLKKAIDASNVRYEPDDVQDRLHITMHAAPGRGAVVADVLALEYRVGGVLASLLSPNAMQEYAQVSTFVWKLKTMEFNLQRAFLALRRVEVLLRRALRGTVESGHDMWHLLKQAHRVRSGLHGFCQTLQTYVMFDVIEGGWGTFATAIEQAQDVDEMLAAHGAYLADIRARALLDSRAEGFRATLDGIFDCAAQLLHPLADCEAHVAACAATGKQMEDNLEAGKWGAFRDIGGDIATELTDAAAAAQARVSTLDGAYAQRLMMLLDEHSDAMHFDLRFVMMQVNFSGFYKPALDGREAEFAL